MGLTQKYKQQQQQVRVITNESNFANGMFYTDAPLAEGYSKVLVNFDIDPNTGKLSPRKGLQTTSVEHAEGDDYNVSFSNLEQEFFSRVISVKDIAVSPRIRETVILYYAPVYKDSTSSDKASLHIMSFNTEKPSGYFLSGIPSAKLKTITDIVQPVIHNKRLLHDYYMQRIAHTYALGAHYLFLDMDGVSKLCYIKRGSEIDRNKEHLVHPVSTLIHYHYYYCYIAPEQSTPTEAASWGYNMLLEDPYTFKCEETAVNLVTITGILPYDKNGEVVLTPARGEEITLKGYYRAPQEYHSDLQNGRYYSTKQASFVDAVSGETILLTKDELAETITDGVANPNYGFGTWCKADDGYYMVMPDGSLDKAKLDKFGDTKPGASVKLNVLTAGDENEIRVRWQTKSGGAAEWTDLSNETFTLQDYYKTHGDHAPFAVTCTLPADEVLVKLTISDPADTVSAEEYILSTNTIGISAITEENSTALNLTPKKYDLSRCTGMCEWEQRLVLWGVSEAENMIFVSDVNNPGYFPYPNNVDILPEPILAVFNFGNELLALTSTALYLLTWNTTTIGWTHKLVQRNLNIRKEDIPFCQVYKNMFFFKSGEYYYMLVPKSNSGVVGETTLAPISKPIESLLDNFHDTVTELYKKLSNETLPNISETYSFTDRLVNYYTTVDGEKIVVNYVYALNEHLPHTQDYTKAYLYVQLCYNTSTRTWYMRFLQTPGLITAYNISTLTQDYFLSVIPGSFGYDDGHARTLQRLTFKNTIDEHYIHYDYNYNAVGPTKANMYIKNCQYLDTGNREINTELKKRFREVQFKLKTKELTDKQLHTAFYVDGVPIKNLYGYTTRVMQDAGQNVLVVEPVLNKPGGLQDAGELNPTVLDEWTLNQSAFPGRTLWKVRMPVMGKGYTPRMVFLAKNEEDFDLLGYSWVYRTMNAR